MISSGGAVLDLVVDDLLVAVEGEVVALGDDVGLGHAEALLGARARSRARSPSRVECSSGSSDVGAGRWPRAGLRLSSRLKPSAWTS